MKKNIIWIFIGVVIGEIIYNFFFEGKFSIFHILLVTIAMSFGHFLGSVIDPRNTKS